MNQQKQGIFFGWFVVGAAMLCISTGPGPFAFAALGLFILPFEDGIRLGADPDQRLSDLAGCGNRRFSSYHRPLCG